MTVVPPFRPKPPQRTLSQVRSELARAQTQLSARTAASFAGETQQSGLQRATGGLQRLRDLQTTVRTLRTELREKEGR